MARQYKYIKSTHSNKAFLPAKSIGFTFILMIFCSALLSQELMTEQQAITIALQNNFELVISRNDLDIAKVNNSAGNAGMLPTFAINASNNIANSDITSKPAGGSETSQSKISTTYNANALMNWVLFDGGKMFITKSKLNEQQTLGELQLKEKVLQVYADVTSAYYDVVRQKQILLSTKEAVVYNTERLNILQTAYNSGLTAKTNVLQAKIDLNNNLAFVLTQETNILSSKRTLNRILGRSPEIMFEVPDSIPMNFKLVKDSIVHILNANNNTIMRYKKLTEIQGLTLKENNASRFPKFSFNSGYNYTRSTNVGNLLLNNTKGPYIGFSLTIPIYSAGNLSRQVSSARIQLNSAQSNLENIKQEMMLQLQTALTLYENQQKLLTLEQENYSLSKENLEISMQRLKLGQTNVLEVRQAQLSFEGAQTSLLNCRYNLKVAETALKKLLSGF
jgi:outer membrane protein